MCFVKRGRFVNSRKCTYALLRCGPAVPVRELRSAALQPNVDQWHAASGSSLVYAIQLPPAACKVTRTPIYRDKVQSRNYNVVTHLCFDLEYQHTSAAPTSSTVAASTPMKPTASMSPRHDIGSMDIFGSEEKIVNIK